MIPRLPPLDRVVLVRIKKRLELHPGLDQGILQQDGILQMNVVITRTMDKQEIPL